MVPSTWVVSKGQLVHTKCNSLYRKASTIVHQKNWCVSDVHQYDTKVSIYPEPRFAKCSHGPASLRAMISGPYLWLGLIWGTSGWLPAWLQVIEGGAESPLTCSTHTSTSSTMNLTTNDSSNWNLGMFPADIASTIVNSQLALGSAAAVASGLVWYLLRSDDSQVKRIRPLPFFGQWSFFTRFHSRWIQEIPPGEIIWIRYTWRKFRCDFRIATGPSTKDISQDAAKRNDQEELSFFLRHLVPLLKNDRLAKLTPELMSDIERNMKSWGDAGKFDPFEVMYSTVFQLTIRAAGAREIADSVEKCKQLEELYWKVEKGSTPTALFYAIFDQIIKDRQREGRREEDALQTFIDQGDSTVDIIGFIMGTLFAGIVNTGLMSAWIYIHLDQVPEWKDKAVEEIRALLHKYAPLEEYSDLSTAERFSKIPPQAWEDDMPVMEVCIRETIRLIFSGAALRRVNSGDTEIDGKKIPNGTYLVYSTGETHSDPNIYPNPSQYNPGRYAEGQDKAQAYGFLGWAAPGAGRHPCVGRRFAQYEIKSMVSMFLASYTYEVVDSAGKKPDPSVTVPDRNNMYQVSGPFRECDMTS
ncbi:cytochrome P450 [Rhizoctonia solani AG-1 IA]|uniref:Cytochrome P450 n=1 Tax=Thanatephorus cucumeris (strain AG1-IA) TaxID=983506 RepID=L8X4U1_THACA|nr:cytochrome P450 [Rhizoctonia solani AG-1 IA]